jgi:hypothetical protein
MFSRWVTVLVVPLSSSIHLVPGVAAAQERCQEIRFAPGASSGTIEGEIPPEAQLCYTIKVGDGQRAEALIEGPEAQFPVIMIDGLTGDGGEQSVSWLTRAGTYEVRVMTLFRYGANTPFRLRLSVAGG